VLANTAATSDATEKSSSIDAGEYNADKAIRALNRKASSAAGMGMPVVVLAALAPAAATTAESDSFKDARRIPPHMGTKHSQFFAGKRVP
jgi:hypothetical protein